MQASPFQFGNFTGIGTRVGVADTGIDISHPALKQCVVTSVSLLDIKKTQNRETTLSTSTRSDAVGHGTAIAYIIHKKAPAAKIYGIQILDERLTSSIRRMIEAIDWAIEQNLDIINLSLGSTHLHRKNEVEAAIHRANEANLLIVSASHNLGKQSLPASLPGVFGVVAGVLSGRYSYYWEEESRKFIARGDHQRVAGPGGKYLFGFGSSYAAPHITGMIALIRQSMPSATYSQVLDILISNSLTTRPDNEITQRYTPATHPQTIQLIAQKAQQELNSELLPVQTDALLDSVRNIVAEALNLSEEDALRLYSTTLLDPIFNLNPVVAMTIIEGLQRKFHLTINDEDLFLNDIYSLNSLVKAVKRWQRLSNHSSWAQVGS